MREATLAFARGAVNLLVVGLLLLGTGFGLVVAVQWGLVLFGFEVTRGQVAGGLAAYALHLVLVASVVIAVERDETKRRLNYSRQLAQELKAEAASAVEAARRRMAPGSKEVN